MNSNKGPGDNAVLSMFPKDQGGAESEVPAVKLHAIHACACILGVNYLNFSTLGNTFMVASTSRNGVPTLASGGKPITGLANARDSDHRLA